MRAHLWLTLLGFSMVLVNCELLFGFRELEVDAEAQGGEGGETTQGGGGEGGDVTTSDGGGGYGGFGGEGGEGGEQGGFGGEGGFGCGLDPLGTVCTDDLDCDSCYCEDSGEFAMQETVCCEQTCAPCVDCNPSTGQCNVVVISGDDEPSCTGMFFCESGMCLMN